MICNIQMLKSALRWRCTIASLVHFYSILDLPNSTLSECMPTSMSILAERIFRKPRDLYLPVAKSSRYTKSLIFQCSVLWNSLPHSLQCIQSTSSFQHAPELHWNQYKFKTLRHPLAPNHTPSIFRSLTHSLSLSLFLSLSLSLSVSLSLSYHSLSLSLILFYFLNYK